MCNWYGFRKGMYYMDDYFETVSMKLDELSDEEFDKLIKDNQPKKNKKKENANDKMVKWLKWL